MSLLLQTVLLFICYRFVYCSVNHRSLMCYRNLQFNRDLRLSGRLDLLGPHDTGINHVHSNSRSIILLYTPCKLIFRGKEITQACLSVEISYKHIFSLRVRTKTNKTLHGCSIQREDVYGRG